MPPFRVLPPRPQLIRHDPLLHHVGRVTSDPEDLSRESASPEVDCGCTKAGVLLEEAGEDVVGTPPAEEKSAEEQGGGEAVPKAWNTVAT